MDKDGHAIRAVHDLSYRRLVTQMVALDGNRYDAKNVMQESFLSARTHRRSLRLASNSEAWLRTVALNVLRNRCAWSGSRLAGPKFRCELDIEEADHV